MPAKVPFEIAFNEKGGHLLCTSLTQIWNAFIMPYKCQVNCTFGSRCDAQETLRHLLKSLFLL